jgi:purine nucleosidase
LSAGKRRRILIDTDTASDDAVALIMALRSSAVEVVAITVVAGNVGVDQATLNALYTCELCQAEVPVYSGASRPLLRDLEMANWFHGADGLGDHGYAPRYRRPETEHAVETILRVVAENPCTEIITLGPLTNMALALRRKPDLARSISRCVVMGGAPCCEGNVTPAAEFNIWVDPEAAREVFRSGLPIEMVGWQLCRGEAVLNEADIAKVRSFNSELAAFAIDSNSTAISAYRKQTGEVGISLPDPVAMGLLLNSSLCTRASQHYVEIETESALTRGMTVVDRLNVSSDRRNRAVWADALKRRKCSVCWAIDVLGWKSLLFSCLNH